MLDEEMKTALSVYKKQKSTKKSLMSFYKRIIAVYKKSHKWSKQRKNDYCTDKINEFITYAYFDVNQTMFVYSILCIAVANDLTELRQYIVEQEKTMNKIQIIYPSAFNVKGNLLALEI